MKSAALLLLLPVLASCVTASPPTHLPAPGALGPYSGAVRSGELVHLSGRIGQGGGSFEHEVDSTLDAIELQLSELGLGLGDLVSVTVYLTDMGHYEAFNAVYARRVPAPYPARACVAVTALPGGARVEIQAVARSVAARSGPDS